MSATSAKTSLLATVERIEEFLSQHSYIVAVSAQIMEPSHIPYTQCIMNMNAALQNAQDMILEAVEEIDKK